MKEEKSLMGEAKEVAKHYARVVMKGKKDQQRTVGLRMVEYLLMSNQTASDLKLAADRYAMELDEDSKPVGLRTFYLDRWQDFLSEDWEPPEDVLSEWRFDEEKGGFVK